MKKITVIYIIPNAMTTGGIERFLLNYFFNFNKERISCVFCQLSSEKGMFDDVIIKNGGYVEYINSNVTKISNYKKYLKIMIEKYKPDIFHINGDADCCKILIALRLLHFKNVISHSHNTDALYPKSIKLKRFMTALLSKYHFACSKKAGEWLFGKDKKTIIINNAIDLERYSFSELYRNEIRESLNISKEAYVVGHIGHFIDNHKNQSRIVSFANDLKNNRNIIFILIGEGPDFERIRNKACSLTNIIFTGKREDAFKFYSVFDAFCLPSYFEGSPFVLIEAICSGLSPVISTNVPIANGLGTHMSSLPLESSNAEWIEKICNSKNDNRHSNFDFLNSKNYNIVQESIRLVDIYMNIIGEKGYE